MKFSFLFILTILTHPLASAQIFEGKVVEENYINAIKYARIGILHAHVGTVANDEGYFSIDLTEFSDNDTIRFSAIGFENMEFLISHCREFLIPQVKSFIVLPAKSQNIEEVFVSAGKFKKIIIGNNIKSPMIVAGFQDRELGSELGTMLKFDKKNKGRVVSFNFNVSSLQNDSLIFRVNLYKMENGLPGQNMLKTPIYAFSKLSSGIISVDLSEESIYIKEDSFLSIELIEDINFEGIFFKSGFLRSPSFHRPNSESEWKKAAVDLGVWAEVVYKK